MSRADCERFQDVMSEYIDAELPAEDATALEQHVASCPACAGYLETLRETVALCRSTPRPCLGRDCVERAIAAAREELARRGLIAP